MKCPICKGRGQVPEPGDAKDPAYITCPACDGDGNHPGACRVPTQAEAERLARDFPGFVRPVNFDEE